MIDRRSLGELSDRRHPVDEAERHWPECPSCGSGHVVRVGLRMACETCGHVVGEAEGAAA
jgi:ribosomal protein L37AE/L43A